MASCCMRWPVINGSVHNFTGTTKLDSRAHSARCAWANPSFSRYQSPVWSRSAHTSQVDVQLNSTMCLISGTLRSTPLPSLPVLSNIEPPALQRKGATDKLVEKIVKHDSWPIQPDILNTPLLWLISRKLLWLDLQPVDIKSRWRHNWKSAQVVNSHLVCDGATPQSGNRVSSSLGNSALCWTIFARNRDIAVPAEGNGDLQTLICVLVAKHRRCSTLSNPVPWQNWMAAYLGYILRMKTLFHGWSVKVHDMHMKRRRIRQRNSGYRPSRVNIMAQGLSTPDPSLSPTHLSIKRGRATTTHYTHHQVSLMVSHNTTLVPSLGLHIGPACEAGLSAAMRKEHESPQIRKKEKKNERKKDKTVDFI